MLTSSHEEPKDDDKVRVLLGSLTDYSCLQNIIRSHIYAQFKLCRKLFRNFKITLVLIRSLFGEWRHLEFFLNGNSPASPLFLKINKNATSFRKPVVGKCSLGNLRNLTIQACANHCVRVPVVTVLKGQCESGKDDMLTTSHKNSRSIERCETLITDFYSLVQLNICTVPWAYLHKVFYSTVGVFS